MVVEDCAECCFFCCFFCCLIITFDGVNNLVLDRDTEEDSEAAWPALPETMLPALLAIAFPELPRQSRRVC